MLSLDQYDLFPESNNSHGLSEMAQCLVGLIIF